MQAKVVYTSNHRVLSLAGTHRLYPYTIINEDKCAFFKPQNNAYCINVTLSHLITAIDNIM